MIAQGILILFNILNAANDAERISKDKTIHHWLNWLAYMLVVVGQYLVFKMTWAEGVVFAISAFFNRQLFFDIPLNLMRKLAWDYVTKEKPPKAIMDRIEIRIFGYNGKLPVLIYSTLWILSIVIFKIV